MDQESSPPAPENEPAPAEGASSSSEISKDARTMALLSHLLGVFTSFLVPLIIWLIKKDDDAFIEDQSKEALNFQITIMIASVVLVVLTIITVGFAGLLFPFLYLYNLIFGIIAALKANEGQSYRYPMTIRLIK